MKYVKGTEPNVRLLRLAIGLNAVRSVENSILRDPVYETDHS